MAPALQIMGNRVGCLYEGIINHGLDGQSAVSSGCMCRSNTSGQDGVEPGRVAVELCRHVTGL
jgi:hypothetical protein